MSEWLRVTRLRLEAFGSDRPVADFARCVTYLPDGSVRPFRRFGSVAELRAARRAAP